MQGAGCSNLQFAGARCRCSPAGSCSAEGTNGSRIHPAAFRLRICMQQRSEGCRAGHCSTHSPQHPPAAPPAGEATQHGYGVLLPDPRACTVPSGLRHPKKNPSAACVVPKHGDTQV